MTTAPLSLSALAMHPTGHRADSFPPEGCQGSLPYMVRLKITQRFLTQSQTPHHCWGESALTIFVLVSITHVFKSPEDSVEWSKGGSETHTANSHSQPDSMEWEKRILPNRCCCKTKWKRSEAGQLNPHTPQCSDLSILRKKQGEITVERLSLWADVYC